MKLVHPKQGVNCIRFISLLFIEQFKTKSKPHGQITGRSESPIEAAPQKTEFIPFYEAKKLPLLGEETAAPIMQVLAFALNRQPVTIHYGM